MSKLENTTAFKQIWTDQRPWQERAAFAFYVAGLVSVFFIFITVFLNLGDASFRHNSIWFILVMVVIVVLFFLGTLLSNFPSLEIKISAQNMTLKTRDTRTKTFSLNEIQELSFFNSSIENEYDEGDCGDWVEIDEITRTFQIYHTPKLSPKEIHYWLRISLPENQNIAICVPEIEELRKIILEHCPKLR